MRHKANASAGVKSGPVRVEYLPLDRLIRAPRNPKAHDLGALHESYQRFGYVAPILLDDRTGRIVAGHGRLDALQQLKASGGTAPARIRVQNGRWLIPVVRGISFASELDAEAYLITDNQLTMLGGWNELELARLLGDLAGTDALNGTGFDRDDVDRLLRETGEIEENDGPAPKLAQAEALQKKWKIARGQTWEIGPHRLRCGDATQPDEVARLMGEARAGLMNTDPPYGVNVWQIANSRRAAGYSQPHYDPIENDDLDGAALQTFLEASIRAARPHLVDNPAFYLWHPMLTQGTFFAAAAADILIHRQIIWVKPSLILGRGDYHWRHELCFYGWIRGHRCPWLAGRDQDTIWEVGRESDGTHPTQKPVELFRRPILNHLEIGGLCYEPFAGSGTQFVAAEQTGRVCHGMEIEPKYVAVILQRLADLGLRPRLVNK